MKASFSLFVRSTWSQKKLLMLWVKNGRVLCSKSMVGTTNDFSHEPRYLDPGQSDLLLSKEHSCGSRRPGGEKHKSVHGCTVDDNLSVLNSVTVKKERRVFLASQTRLCLSS